MPWQEHRGGGLASRLTLAGPLALAGDAVPGRLRAGPARPPRMRACADSRAMRWLRLRGRGRRSGERRARTQWRRRSAVASSILLKDSSMAVGSEQRRAAGSPRSGPARGEGGWRAGATPSGTGHAGTQPGPQRAALEGRAQTCCTCTCTGTWVQRVLVVRKAERAVRCGSKRDASAGRHGWRRRERRGWRGAAFGRRPAGD